MATFYTPEIDNDDKVAQKLASFLELAGLFLVKNLMKFL